MIKFDIHRIENILGKGENAGNQYFLLKQEDHDGPILLI